MIDLTVKVDTKATTQFLNDVQMKQVPFATSVAINKTARLAEADIKSAMRLVINNPKPYTMNATFVVNSTKHKLEAKVGLKDRATNGRAAGVYLTPMIAGIPRKQTGWERALQGIGAMPSGMRAVPADGAKLDSYGNINKKQVTEIMGALRTRMRTFKGRGKRQSAVGYFVAMPSTPATKHLQAGIYQRIERQGQSVLKPIVVYVSSATYRPVLKLHEIVKRTVDREFDGQFAAALRYGLATAR